MANDDNASEMSDMTELMCVLLEQNRLHEQQMELIITRLTNN